MKTKLIPIRDDLAWRATRLCRPDAHTDMKNVPRGDYDDSSVMKILDIEDGREQTTRERKIVRAVYHHTMRTFASTGALRFSLNGKGRPVAHVLMENAEIEFDLEDALSDLANEEHNGVVCGDRKKLVAYRALAERLTATMDAWIAELDGSQKPAATGSGSP